MRRSDLAFAIVVAVIGAGLFALPTRATRAAPACPPEIVGQLVNVSRAIVPIGSTATRSFQVKPGGGAAVSGMQLSAPAEYSAKQLPAMKGAYALQLDAPRAGPFVVQGSWTAKYNDRNGDDQTCVATATSALRASNGTPLKLSPPAVRKFPGVAGTQYDLPLMWTWKCTADSDPTPLTATVQWEIDQRPLPVGSKGGHAPFRFGSGSKTFMLSAGDSCDAQQVGTAKMFLPQHARLTAFVGGDMAEGTGSVWVGLKDAIGGEFRNSHGNAAPFHLGVTLKQGSRTLLDARVCAWYHESGFLLARGKNVSCWW